MIPASLRERNVYRDGEAPEVGDVVQSDALTMLVLQVEPPDADSFGAVRLIGTLPEAPSRPGSKARWMSGPGRCEWLPWRCRLIRRGAALGELA